MTIRVSEFIDDIIELYLKEQELKTWKYDPTITVKDVESIYLYLKFLIRIGLETRRTFFIDNDAYLRKLRGREKVDEKLEVGLFETLRKDEYDRKAERLKRQIEKLLSGFENRGGF